MRYLLTLTLFGIMAAGCSPRPSVKKENAPNNPDIANVAPEGRFTETAPGETGPLQPDMTAIPLTAVQGNAPATSAPSSVPAANWQTFTSAALGATVKYPPDWSVEEKTDGATFTSPNGAAIQLEKATASMKSKEFKIGNQQCTSRTNEYGLTADICVDNASFTYTANFTLQAADGSIQRVMLMTKTRAVGNIFEAMFNSLQPAK